MVSTNKRREKDIMKLLVSEYEVTIVNENSNSEFVVKFAGPKDSPYEGVSTEPANDSWCSIYKIPTFCHSINPVLTHSCRAYGLSESSFPTNTPINRLQ